MSIDPDYISPWSYNERRMLRHLLENDGMWFMRYFFKHRLGHKMILNWHHFVIDHVLQAVMDQKINRLIVNIAPGYTKTEEVVVGFIARGLAINPMARFIHTSYSGDLVLDNSSKIKDIVESNEYQELWPVRIRVDAKGKKRWYTDAGGCMQTAPSGGQLTGFRAGHMDKSLFTGAFVIDDPVKPDDAYSIVKRSGINNRFTNTFRSRLAVETNPMIVIMQRIHDDDMTGYLLRGGSGDKWYHLNIPTYLDAKLVDKPYPDDYTHGIPIDLREILDCVREGRQYDFEAA